MVHPELSPSAGALEEVRRLAGASAAIQSVTRLEGGQHADTWRVDTARPALTVIVRQFPAGDPAGAREQQVLRALDGLGGLAPELLSGDLNGRWSEHPTSLISWLDGHADITPTDPESWAAQLGHGLAAVHAAPGDRFAALPSVFARGGGTQNVLEGPLRDEAPVRLEADHRLGRGAHALRLLVGQRRLARRERSRASSTGRAEPAVHAASTWAGAALISFSSSTSASPTCSWRPTRMGSAARSTTSRSGMAGPSRARTMRSKPGLRTTRRSGALTSPHRSFADATRGGQRASWNGRRHPGQA